MDWRERCGNKLVSLDVAIKEVKSGFTVSVAPYTTTATGITTTTPSPPSSSRSGAAIRTRPSTGWRECWRAGMTRSSSPAGS